MNTYKSTQACKFNLDFWVWTKSGGVDLKLNFVESCDMTPSCRVDRKNKQCTCPYGAGIAVIGIGVMRSVK